MTTAKTIERQKNWEMICLPYRERKKDWLKEKEKYFKIFII